MSDTCHKGMLLRVQVYQWWFSGLTCIGYWVYQEAGTTAAGKLMMAKKKGIRMGHWYQQLQRRDVPLGPLARPLKVEVDTEAPLGQVSPIS